MTKSKVLIGGPICDIYEYCLDEYLKALKTQTYQADILLIDNSVNENFFNLLKEKGINVIHSSPETNAYETLVQCRNLMIEYAIKNNYDYIFFCDADTIIPNYALEKLLSSNKEIISGVVYNRFTKEGKDIISPALWIWVSEKEFNDILRNPQLYPDLNDKIKKFNISSPDKIRRQLTEEEIQEPRIIDIKLCGAACLLISRIVFMNTRFNLDAVDKLECEGEDIGFCYQAINNGYKIYVNTEIVCRHLIIKKPKNIFPKSIY